MNAPAQEAQKDATGAVDQQHGAANGGDNNHQEPQFDLNTATKEQFLDRIKVDEELRNDYMNNFDTDEKFSRINSLIDGTPPSDPSQQQKPPAAPAQQGDGSAAASAEVAGAAPGSANQAEETIDLTGVKIPKGLFGSYLTEGRSASEAVIEALKGNREKDNTIANFVQRDNNHSNDTLALRKELIKAQKERADAQLLAESLKNSQPAQPVFGNVQEIGEIDFDVLNEFDPFDPTHHQRADKARETLGKLKKVFDGLKDKQPQQQPGQTAAPTTQPQQPGQEPQPSQQQQQPAVDPEVQKTRNALEKSVYDMEMADIQALQASFPELQTTIPFPTLNLAVGNFQNSVARVAGMPNNVDAATKLYFSNSPEGERLREQCKTQGVNIPGGDGDYDKFVKIAGEVRSLRLKNIDNYRSVVEEKAGKKLESWELLDAPGISYRELYTKVEPYKPRQSSAAPQPSGGGNPPQPSQKLQQAIEQHTAPPAQRTVPEIPPSMGSPQVGDVGGMLASEAEALIVKFNKNPKSLNQDEVAKLRRVYEYAQPFGGPDPSVIDQRLKE